MSYLKMVIYLTIIFKLCLNFYHCIEVFILIVIYYAEFSKRVHHSNCIICILFYITFFYHKYITNKNG